MIIFQVQDRAGVISVESVLGGRRFQQSVPKDEFIDQFATAVHLEEIAFWDSCEYQKNT